MSSSIPPPEQSKSDARKKRSTVAWKIFVHVESIDNLAYTSPVSLQIRKKIGVHDEKSSASSICYLYVLTVTYKHVIATSSRFNVC